jgi:hypothetical protein
MDNKEKLKEPSEAVDVKEPAVSFTLRDGTVVSYDTDFNYDDDLLKKLRCVRRGDAEGPWMWIHQDDEHDYEHSVRDRGRVRLGVAANHFLNGIGWGCVFPYVLKGDDRPECDMDMLIDLESKPVFSSKLKEAMEKQENESDSTDGTP